MAEIPYQSKHLALGIHAFDGGAGTPIVCVPGWPQTGAAFAEIFPLLSKSHRVLVLEPPGLGESLPSESGYDTKAISNTLFNATASELGPDTQYHLVGHDVGAWIAYAWAAQYSSSLLSLTLIDATIPGLSSTLNYPLPYEANVKLWQFSFNSLPDLPEILTQGRERELLDWLFDRKSAHPERITRTKRDHYVACYARPGGMSNGFAYYRAIHESIRQNREELGLEKLPVPILAIGGKLAAGPLMKSVLSATARMEESRHVSLEDCGHYVMEEQPEVTAQEILSFIAQNRA